MLKAKLITRTMEWTTCIFHVAPCSLLQTDIILIWINVPMMNRVSWHRMCNIGVVRWIIFKWYFPWYWTRWYVLHHIQLIYSPPFWSPWFSPIFEVFESLTFIDNCSTFFWSELMQSLIIAKIKIRESRICSNILW